MENANPYVLSKRKQNFMFFLASKIIYSRLFIWQFTSITFSIDDKKQTV